MDFWVPAGTTEICGVIGNPHATPWGEAPRHVGPRPGQRQLGAPVYPLGNPANPSDMVSKTSSSMACTIADCDAGHFPLLIMLELRWRTIIIAAGACCA